MKTGLYMYGVDCIVSYITSELSLIFINLNICYQVSLGHSASVLAEGYAVSNLIICTMAS
jgi:hypothetical protein